jgi:hypothetical protein
MNKLLVSALAKMIFIFFPIALMVFYGCYLLDKAMIARDMRQFAYLPALLSAALLYYIARLLVASDLKRMAKLRRREKGS